MRYVYVFSADGQTCHQAHLGYQGEIPFATLAKRHPGCVVGVFAALRHPDAPKEQLRASIEGGEVVAVEAVEEPCLWLHGAAEGGSTNPQGTRYVRRGETLTFAAAIRIGADPASAVVESDPGTGQPLTQEWGLELRGVSGAMWCPIVAVTNGQASGAVVVPERLPDGDFHLPEELLARIGGYRLRLADPAAWAFKVVG